MAFAQPCDHGLASACAGSLAPQRTRLNSCRMIPKWWTLRFPLGFPFRRHQVWYQQRGTVHTQASLGELLCDMYENTLSACFSGIQRSSETRGVPFREPHGMSPSFPEKQTRERTAMGLSWTHARRTPLTGGLLKTTLLLGGKLLCTSVSLKRVGSHIVPEKLDHSSFWSMTWNFGEYPLGNQMNHTCHLVSVSFFGGVTTIWLVLKGSPPFSRRYFGEYGPCHALYYHG